MSVVLEAIVRGMGLGLLLAFLIGPVFFVLLQTSIRQGVKSGVLLALGIVISDAAYIILALWGVAELMKEYQLNLYFGIIGGVFILIYGITLFFKKAKLHEGKEVHTRGIWLVSKGFLLNALNPSVLIYWLGVVTAVGAQYEYDKYYLLPLMISTLITVFATDSLKAYFSSRIKKVITEHILNRLNQLVGSGLVLFSIYIFYYVFTRF